VGDEQNGGGERYGFAHTVGQGWATLRRRDPGRIDRVSAKFVELWKLESDQRLGQLMVNVMRRESGRIELPDVQLMEDDRLERLLDAELELQRARHRETDSTAEA